MFERLVRFVLDHRALTWALYGALAVAACAGLVWLRVDLSFHAFFGRNDPANAAFREYSQHWGTDDDTVLVVIDAGGEDLLVPERMRAMRGVADELEALPIVRSVTALHEAPFVLGQGPGELDLTPLIDLMPREPGPELEAWRARVVGSRLLVPSLVAKDGRTAAMLVELVYDSGNVNEIRPLVAEVRQRLGERDGEAGLHFAMAGIPAVRAAFFDQILRDQSRTVPAAALFIAATLWLVFRRWSAVLVPGIAAFVPMVMVFGILGWTGEPVGLLTQTFSTMLPALAVADAIHLVSRTDESLRSRLPAGGIPTKAQRVDAIREATSHVGMACALTALTTSVGFLSLLTARMPILQTYGLYAAVGIGLALVGVVTLQPLLLVLARSPVAAQDQDGLPERLVGWCVDAALARPRTVLVVTAVLVAIGAGFGTRVVVDNNLTLALQADHPVTRANLHADRDLGGILPVEVDLKGPPDAMKDPAVLAALLAFESWALELPQVSQVTSPATWVALLHQATTGEYRAPESREAAAQFYLLTESDPMFARVMDPDYGRARMMLTMRDEGGIAFTDLSDRLEAKLQEMLAGLPVEGHVTGTPFVAYRGINGVTNDLRGSLTLEFLVISAIISLLFRDVRTGIICIIPNSLPLVAGYGMLGALGWLLDPTPAVVFTVALGIAVDDTVHLLARAEEELQAGRSLPDAVREAAVRSGRAVLVTSGILTFAFGINVLSSFRATAVLGWIGATVIVVALACDLFVLPALLVLFGRGRRKVAA